MNKYKIRKILWDFLKDLDNSHEYTTIINHLEELIIQAK